jgi:hypothetical protein
VCAARSRRSIARGEFRTHHRHPAPPDLHPPTHTKIITPRAKTAITHSNTYSHQRARELELAPSARYLEERHASAAASAANAAAAADQFLSPEMRVIVTSWLAEVADEFGLQQETLHLAVALLDRFLSATTAVPRGALQLLAVACVMVAAKDLEVCGARIFLILMIIFLLRAFVWLLVCCASPPVATRPHRH